MKSANNELTTARNTPNPIVAAGKDDAPCVGDLVDRADLQPGLGHQSLLR